MTFLGTFWSVAYCGQFWIVPFRLSLWPDGRDVWRDLRSLGRDGWMRLLLLWCDRRVEWLLLLCAWTVCGVPLLGSSGRAALQRPNFVTCLRVKTHISLRGALCQFTLSCVMVKQALLVLLDMWLQPRLRSTSSLICLRHLQRKRLSTCGSQELHQLQCLRTTSSTLCCWYREPQRACTLPQE